MLVWSRSIHLSLMPKSYRRRHTTWQAMHRVDEGVIQGILGHMAVSRVMKTDYVQATDEDKREVIISFPFVDHSRTAKS